MRTDRSLPFYEGDDNPNVNILRDILLTYSFYNFDLGYCQVTMPWLLDLILIAVNLIYILISKILILFFLEVESSFFVNIYVVTTAGRGILMAIVFLNQVYFETMNHYASSYAVYPLPPLVRLNK